MNHVKALDRYRKACDERDEAWNQWVDACVKYGAPVNEMQMLLWRYDAMAAKAIRRMRTANFIWTRENMPLTGYQAIK